MIQLICTVNQIQNSHLEQMLENQVNALHNEQSSPVLFGAAPEMEPRLDSNLQPYLLPQPPKVLG